MSEPSLPIRWIVVLLLAVAASTFFFPLVSIHIPIEGNQEWSGYDLVARGRDVDHSLDSMQEAGKRPELLGDTGNTDLNPAEPRVPTSAEVDTMPLSVQALRVIPIEIAFAFVAAVLALFLNLNRNAARAVTFVSLCGGIAAGVAILHLVIANSDWHVWLQNQTSAGMQSGDTNPFAGLASALAGMAINAFQLKPGVGLYVLGAALFAAGILARAIAGTRASGSSEDEPFPSWSIVPKE